MKNTFQVSLLLLVLFTGMSHGTEQKLNVFTVNYPLKYFTERIGGDYVKVHFPTPKNIDPAFWTPDTTIIGQYQRANLILINGAGYAKWLSKVSLPRLRLFNTSSIFSEQYLTVEELVTHKHGPGGDHFHAGRAFTTWLDFHQATQQALTIKQALQRKQPQHRQAFEQNFEGLQADLLTLDKAMENLNTHNRPLLASHPVYQYLSRRYQLNLKSVMWEPNEIPTAQQWRELQQRLKLHPAKLMIWEKTPNTVSVKRLKSMGITSIVFDPCGNQPEAGDFLSVMQQNIINLKTAFQ